MSSLKRFALLQMTILNAFFNLAVSTVFVIPLHIHYPPQQTNIKLFQFNYLTTHNTTMPSISLCCFSPYQMCHKQFPIPLLRCQQNATPSFHYATIEFCFCCWFFFWFHWFLLLVGFTNFSKCNIAWTRLPIMYNVYVRTHSDSHMQVQYLCEKFCVDKLSGRTELRWSYMGKCTVRTFVCWWSERNLKRCSLNDYRRL